MKLGSTWRDPDMLAGARARWAADRSLRLDGFLADEVTVALRDAVRALYHPLIGASPPGFGYQYGAFASPPEDDCAHVWCQFGRWWWSDGLGFVAALTGMALAAPVDRRLVATLFQRGSFLDPHNDHDGMRRCAYVLGLTDASWPAADGGHLEFLTADGELRERRAPGWNTLDLFDVTGTACLHQVPIVTRDVERRAFTGWFF